MIDIIKTSHSVNPWRLFVGGKSIPYSHCRTKRDAMTLKEKLEAVANWSQLDQWDDDSYAQVREVLFHTDAARIEAEGLKASARWGTGR